MYERFTDRARRAMQLANQEAQRFNHTHIGAEYVLMGIVKQGVGMAVTVLGNLGIAIDLRTIREETERRLWAGDFVHLRDGKWWRCKPSESVQATAVRDTGQGEWMDPAVGEMKIAPTELRDLPTPDYIERQ